MRTESQLLTSLHDTSSTGPVWVCWAFGMTVPLCCTSQQRTCITDKDQLSLTNPCDTLHHGEHAANK